MIFSSVVCSYADAPSRISVSETSGSYDRPYDMAGSLYFHFSDSDYLTYANDGTVRTLDNSLYPLRNDQKITLMINHSDSSAYRKKIMSTSINVPSDSTDHDYLIHDIYISGSDSTTTSIFAGLHTAKVSPVGICLPENFFLADDLQIHIQYGSSDYYDISTGALYWEQVIDTFEYLAPYGSTKKYSDASVIQTASVAPTREIVAPPPPPPVDPPEEFVEVLDVVQDTFTASIGFIPDIAAIFTENPVLLCFLTLVLMAFVIGLFKRLINK